MQQIRASGTVGVCPWSGTGGGSMRGRKPRPLKLADADVPVLRAVASHRRLCWFQVQHARIVLAVAAGEPVGRIASDLRCDRTTVWRARRRYELGGLSKLLLDDPRPGRP